MKNILYLVVFRLVSSDRISITIPDSNVEAVSAGIAKQISTMGGGYKTCYLASLTAQSKTFNVQVDTGSSDTVLPASILNNYTGPSLTYSSSMGTTSLADHYADTSYWSGYQVSMVIGVTGTSLSTTANVALMTQQSTNPIFADGSNSNGLVGLGFPILAAIQSSPQTIMDAFYASGQISQKQVAIHGCPYSQVSQAYIDIGNTSPYQSCSNVSATITMPYKSYYTVDVRAVYVGGNLVSLPSSFQSFTTNQYGGRYWSFMDSCNSDISLPQSVLYALQTAVQNSGGLPLQITTSGYLTQWLNSEVRISVSSNSFIWSALPTLAFNVSTGGLNPTIVQFVLGPQQYIQADSSGYCKLLLTLDGFIVSSSPDYYVVLGLPFFSAFHVVADLNAGQLAVSIGCACSYSTDGNPKIVTSNTSAGAPITNVQSAGASSYKGNFQTNNSYSIVDCSGDFSITFLVIFPKARFTIDMLLFLLLIIQYFVGITALKSDLHLPSLFSGRKEGISRQKSTISGGLNTCLLTNIIYNQESFLVQIDTGSSDTALPGHAINNFSGPTIPLNITDTSEKIFNVYADGSSWTGGAILLDIALDNIDNYTSAPVGLITSQSTNPTFIDGHSYSGLLGIAYPALANIKFFNPNNIIDTLVHDGVIPRNQVAIHACDPSNYWIDYGNTTVVESCAKVNGIVTSPSLTFYTLNIVSTSIAGIAQPLPSNFQCKSRQALGGQFWSILDSCTNFLAMPADLVYNLQTLLINSNGLPNELLSSQDFNNWLYQLFPTPYTNFKWHLLPNISFTINTGGADPRNLTITIGPENYILPNGNGQYIFAVQSADSRYITLGLPIFLSFHIVLDRALGQISFDIPCDCKLNSLYPKMHSVAADSNSTSYTNYPYDYSTVGDVYPLGNSYVTPSSNPPTGTQIPNSEDNSNVLFTLILNAIFIFL